MVSHLHNSIVIRGNSITVLFYGLPAKLPTILDSFLPVAITSDYIRVVGSHTVKGRTRAV